MGSVAFVLFASANSFGDLRDPVSEVRQPLDGRETYRIKDVAPGTYALLVYYDENNNDRLDRNFIGIPKEPIGFSNRYEPKGPPGFDRAAFVLAKGESRHFDVKLRRLLGKRGRVGAGLGVIAQTSPYRDYDGGVYKVVPALVYNGERLQLYGPFVRFGLVGGGKLRLAATGQYRIRAYEEDGSAFLAGMGDRKDTVMAGVSFMAELPQGLDLSMDYRHDILGEIGGGEVSMSLGKSFQIGPLRFTPRIGSHWLNSKLTDHDFGVRPSEARPDRPAYSPDSAISVEAGVGIFWEITRDWLLVLSMNVEFLDSEVKHSPIVSEDYVMNGFAAISYVF